MIKHIKKEPNLVVAEKQYVQIQPEIIKGGSGDDQMLDVEEIYW